jgi:hypothetical protein
MENAVMSKSQSLGNALAWPFLLPGNLVCDALHLGSHTNLVRMLVNQLVWTVIGVIAVAIVV